MTRAAPERLIARMLAALCLARDTIDHQTKGDKLAREGSKSVLSLIGAVIIEAETQPRNRPSYDDLANMLTRVLPYIESAIDDTTYKPGVVQKLALEIGRMILRAEIGETLRLDIGKRRIFVGSLAEASATYAEIRDASREGASTFPTGVILRDDKRIATVSYNAKVFDNARACIFDPYSAEHGKEGAS